MPNKKVMKMTFLHANTATSLTPARAFFGALSGVFARSIKGAQVAQMISVLNRFSDAQLKDIGVSRCEIAQHAEAMVNGSASVS
jgi:uncharacterized protein YjiS (DUF1127 family)